ncbi:MAG: DUF192 domain-containing protein [Candidatus Kerfeldbacteria bacterium]
MKLRVLTGVLAIIVIGAVIAVPIWYFTMSESKIQFNELIINGTSFDIEVADTAAARNKGLSGRTSLAMRHGMLFVFGNSAYHQFWMYDTHIPLDFIWISGDAVMEVTADVLPEPGKSMSELTRYQPKVPVDKVLEINAGEAAVYDIKAGDRIVFTPAAAK